MTGAATPTETTSTLADISSFLFDDDRGLSSEGQGQDNESMSDFLNYIMQLPDSGLSASTNDSGIHKPMEDSTQVSTADSTSHMLSEAQHVVAYGAGLNHGIVGHVNNFQVSRRDKVLGLGVRCFRQSREARI